MEGIFKIIITTSLYASVVGLIIILLKYMLSNRLNPKWHFLIWSVLIFKLIVPFGPESAFSLFNVVSQVADHNPVTLAYEQIYPATTPAEISQHQFQPNPFQNIESGVEHTSIFSQLMKGLPYIWLFVSIVLMLWLFYTNFLLHRRLNNSQRAVPASINVIFEECKQRMGINRDIKIIVQETIESPAIFGVITPKILISPKTLELNNRELSYILMHELAHYKRKDLLTNYLLLGLQVIHWFNPVIWYCFRMIRRDMEIAADDKVLSVLKYGEEKEYGKALLTVLESFNTSRFLPKLIGMVDDNRNIKRRINIIKTAELFQRKRTFFLLTGVISVILLSVVLLTNPLTNTPNEVDDIQEYHADNLIKYKNPYVGDASNVGNLIRQLPYAEFSQGISLQTENTPYGITAKYDFTTSDKDADLGQIEIDFYNNSLVMFALIDNVDLIEFNLITVIGEQKLGFSREQLQQSYKKDLREYATDKSDFVILLNSIDLKLLVNPPKYTPAMSSTPGIRISPQYKEYEVTADEVHYSTSSGSFIGWHSSSGKVIQLGSNIELSYDSPIYWSPGESGSYEREPDNPRSIPVHISINRNGKIVAEKQLIIRYDGVGLYSVEPAYHVLVGQTIDQAISQAVKDQGHYRVGEVATEGHILLDTEVEDGITTAYTIASFGYFGFENGIFTKISGSGAIPTVITFKQNEYGQHIMLTYQEPMDGAGYLDSVKKMFPERYWTDVFPEGNRYLELQQQQEEQAREYLKSIGRTATVQASHVEKKLPNISVPASNTLFAKYTKYDSFLNTCPYWIGTREEVENGERYIYETSQSKTEDGYDLVTFSKSKDDGTVVQEARYKIVGDEPQLITH